MTGTLVLDNGIDTGELLPGYWRCGDCLRVWPDSQDGCPCWEPTAEEIAEVERDRIVRNGGKEAQELIRGERRAPCAGGEGVVALSPPRCSAFVISAEGET